MVMKIAAVSGLLAFAISILAGVQGENSFETAVSRALLAMGATFLVGLLVGWMAQRMLDERVEKEEAEFLQTKTGEQDR